MQRVVEPERAGRASGALPMRADEVKVLKAREARWRAMRDHLSRPAVDWSPRAQRRRGWKEPARALGSPRGATAASIAGTPPTPPDTLRVAFVRIDFLADRGGDASTGTGRFDLTPRDTTIPPVDRPPHNRTFYLRHLEALRRYYDAESYGRVVIEGDVWPRVEDQAYSLSDMADLGPWEFSQDIYARAVHMFRAMAFAADSQSTLRGDRIPWDDIDRVVFIHAGGDLQSDVRQDSPEDIPSFTIGVLDTDRVIFPDSANVPLDRAAIIPETNNQDGYYGAINGVLAHECGHLFFGFADLYDVNTGLPVVGFWSLMDSGNLVGSRVVLPDSSEIFATGLLPPSVDPWHRFYIGDALTFPEVFYGDSIQALQNGERHPDMRRVTLSSDEYLLLENRWQAPANVVELDQDSLTRVVLGPLVPDRFEYDALLPGAGVLVWHIDSSVIPFETSMRINPDYGFNTNPLRHGIDVIEADWLDDLGDPGSPFLLGGPYDPWFANNNSVLSDTTRPNLIPHIGTRPHRRLDFHTNPAPTMFFSASRTWALPAWPVTADFPPGGPILLAVDADGDRQLEVCWAGGGDSLSIPAIFGDSLVVNPDANALFAVRPNGAPLDSTYAFAHLDRRPMPVMAALPTGEVLLPGQPAQGPSLFAVTTYASGPDTTTPGGRVWLLDAHGQAQPGWPVTLPAPATTPPVISGVYPTANLFVGAADGHVYVLDLSGTVLGSIAIGASAGPVTGRLAVVQPPSVAVTGVAGGAVFVAAGTRDGWVGAAAWPPILCVQGPCVGFSRRIAGDGFEPDFLWLDFDGSPTVPTVQAPDAVCPGRGPELVVHDADRLWAFCLEGTPIPGWGRDVGDTLVAALGAGDPDGDGRPEVLTQSIRSDLAFWNATGYPSPGWPKPGTLEPFRTGSAPLAADVDGDSRSEIVGMNASGIVAALRADGRTPPGWPLASGSGATGSPVLADLDRDGTLDLVAPDRFGILYAYSIPVGTGTPVATSWTMLGGDPGRTSSLPDYATPTRTQPLAGPLVAGSLKAYPNPARRQPVSFAYTLTEPADVEFRILDGSGHEVASFTRRGGQTDNLEVWDPGRLPSGLYLARVRFRGTTSERTMIVPVALLR